jgi:ABC-type nitrate/sulfonate/bicarbonate transport system substrate-binding protein
MGSRKFYIMVCVLVFSTFLHPGFSFGENVSKIRVGVLPGVQLFPFMIMEKYDLLKKNGVEVERQELQNPQAVSVQLSQKAIDLGFVGWTFAMILQSRGYDVVNIYSFALNNNVVIVKKDSPIRNLSDLRGRRIGLYGGPAGLSTATLKIICKKYYNLDLERDAKVHYGSPIAQVGLFEKGDLDAVLSLDPIATRTISKGNCRVIARIDKEWQKYRKHPALLVSMVSNRDFVNANENSIKGFIRAFKESIGILDQNDAIWKDLAGAVRITDPKTVAALRESLHGVYTDAWNPSVIAEIKTVAEEGYNLLGKKFLPVSWNDKAFDLRFGSE